MQIRTKARNGGANQQVSVEDGMGGEGDLEARVVGQEMQISTKNVVTLLAPEVVQKQMQVGGDVGKTFVVHAYKIEVDLEKIYFDDRNTRKCSSYSNVGGRKYK
jgi:hypothetical protein